MSFGLLVVRLPYCLYVCVHLSKFVSLFSVLTRSMSAVSCRFTPAANGPRLCVRVGFGAQSFNLLLLFIKGTKLQVCTSARLTQKPCQHQYIYLNSSSISLSISSSSLNLSEKLSKKTSASSLFKSCLF
jgi:hypothetical protein